MKKTLLSLLTMVSILVFSSCSSEDEPTIVNNAQAIAGTYNGYTNSSSQYFSGMIAENQSVTIIANEDGTATVTFNSSSTGNVTINNATVTPTAEGYAIAGTGESVIAGHGDGAAKSYECNLSGKIGSAKDDANLEFTLPSVMNGMKINFIQGTAPANMVAAGDYDGYTLTSTAYFQSMLATDEEVEITANEDGTAAIEFESNMWGKVAIPAAKVERNGNDFTISGSGKVTMPGMNGGAAKEYDCTVAGTINSAKDNVEITFTVPSVMGGTDIKFILGQAPASLVAAGDYDGYFAVSTAYFQQNYDDETVAVAANEDGTVNVTFTSDSWGTANIENATAEYDENGNVIISGDGTIKMGMEGNLKDYACTLTGTVDGDKENATFSFVASSVMGGTTIKFNLGQAPAAE